MRLLLLLALGSSLHAQTGENVLLVVNKNDAISRQIADYYRPRRSVPVKNVCTIHTTSEEEIHWKIYEEQIEQPIGDCLKKAGLVEKVYYIVTTMGVPLKVDGPGSGQIAEHASVDSELALLYGKLKGTHYSRAGRRSQPVLHAARHRVSAPDVSHLSGDAPGGLRPGRREGDDRSLAEARNRGKFVIDLQSAKDEPGNDWLRTAAMLLPGKRVVLDETTKPLYNQTDVIGYASWGSNDDHRKQRWLHFQWLPGAIAAEFVSTSARTFKRPPDNWTYTTWEDKQHWFARLPAGPGRGPDPRRRHRRVGQYVRALSERLRAPRLPAARLQPGAQPGGELLSFMVYLSWQGVIVGDPLCVLKP